MDSTHNLKMLSHKLDAMQKKIKFEYSMNEC